MIANIILNETPWEVLTYSKWSGEPERFLGVGYVCCYIRPASYWSNTFGHLHATRAKTQQFQSIFS